MDINIQTGAKLTGQINTWEKILALPRTVGITGDIETPQVDYYKLDKCAHIADVSKWQKLINWLILWTKLDGCIARLGYGTTYDERWTENRAGLKSGTDKIRGAYHYYNTGATVEQQVNLILEALGYFQPGQLQIFALDVEKAYNAYWSSSFQQDPFQILWQVSLARPDLKVMLYSNLDVWDNYLSPNTDYMIFDMWLAWYPWYPQSTQYPRLPKGRGYEDVYLWQYWVADQGPEYGAGSPAIDLNRSRDTKGEVFRDLSFEEPEQPGDHEHRFKLSRNQERDKLTITVEVEHV